MITIWTLLHWAFGWHHWRVINPTERPASPGYVYYQCDICLSYRKRKPCWVSTLWGHTDGWFQCTSHDGKTWTEPVKVV